MSDGQGVAEEPSSSGRPPWLPWLAAAVGVVAVALVVGLIALGGDDEPDVTASGPSTVPATDSTTSTTRPDTVPTTAPDTAWVPADLPPWATAPCCGEAWAVTSASPPLPASGTPLADGVYAVEVIDGGWSPTEPELLSAQVRRFVPCVGDPTLDECSGFEVDRNESIDLELPLDAALGVGLSGFACGPGPDECCASPQWLGDGALLATLWTAVDADYERWVRSPVAAGASAAEVLAALDADPAAPFSVPDCLVSAGGGVAWSQTGGPTLLFQEVGNEVVAPVPRHLLLAAITLEVVGGRPTLYLARGWSP